MAPLIKPVLIAGVLAALTIPAGALAQPIRDVPTSGKAAVHRHHRPGAGDPSITFTNPLGRARGPGAGAGLL
jgi:hypothetical protein